MTPTQLRAFAEVARQGSVRDAAESLGVSDAAVSMHVAALRKELGDELYHRTASGLAFTPGGLRLASRAVEMLGLQDRTRREVSAAAAGQRTIRLVTTSMFAEYCAPGLIGLFSSRANDLQVELAVQPRERFTSLLATYAADVAIGPTAGDRAGAVALDFLRFQLVAVAAAGSRHTDLQRSTWLLGPSAAEQGLTRDLLSRLRVPESNQRIFQSHAAAVEEARRGSGVALALSTDVARDVDAGRLVRTGTSATTIRGTWSATTLPADRRSDAASELVHFIATPRAIQAMISGSGTDVGRFRPSVHITLWQ